MARRRRCWSPAGVHPVSGTAGRGTSGIIGRCQGVLILTAQQADNLSPEEAEFECEKGCGFEHHDRKTVEKHELHCAAVSPSDKTVALTKLTKLQNMKDPELKVNAPSICA